MSAFTLSVAALAVASFASAKPIAPRVNTKTFTVNQSVAVPKVAGPVALANALTKYGATPAADVAAAAASGSGTVAADPEQYDSEYLCAVDIGGETLNLDFDTGSADLWVFSSELSSSESAGHTVYDPSQSSSAQELQGYTWNITYGDGSSSSGNVYTDTVTVGGISVTGQAVELAEQVSSQFIQDTASDGLLGLAFSSINTVTPQQQTTFFDSAINEGLLAANVFTADLQAGAPGTYDFGFIDSSKYTGSITYAAVDNSQGFWEFTGSGYAIGSASFKSSSIDAIADTGTTLLLLDNSIVTAYYKKVSGSSYDSSQGGYTFPCSATLPSFTLGIGNYHAVIPGTFMNYAPTDNSGTTCYGGIQSNNGIGFSIYGDIFLKSQFVVFDSDNLQVGFAAKPLNSKR